MKPAFQPGDVVMICKHLWRASSCKVAPKIDYSTVRVSQTAKRRGERFTREDGSTGVYNWAVVCLKCEKRGPGDFNLVECVFSDGSLQTADFMGRSA